MVIKKNLYKKSKSKYKTYNNKYVTFLTNFNTFFINKRRKVFDKYLLKNNEKKIYC